MNTVYLAHRCQEAVVVVCIVMTCRQDIEGKLFCHMLVWTKMGTKCSVFCPVLVVICKVRRINVQKDREHTKAFKGSKHRQLWKQRTLKTRDLHTKWQDLPVRTCRLCGGLISCTFPWEKKKFALVTGWQEETPREIMWTFSSQKIVYLKGLLFTILKKQLLFCVSADKIGSCSYLRNISKYWYIYICVCFMH